MPTYYAILGVDPTADRATIKKAYLTQIKKYHPDSLVHHGAHSSAEQKVAVTINKAYAILSDDHLRLEYDAHLQLLKPKARPASSPPTKPAKNQLSIWSSLVMLGLWCLALLLVYFFQSFTMPNQFSSLLRFGQ